LGPSDRPANLVGGDRRSRRLDPELARIILEIECARERDDA
jgi:hypothetical protein